MNVNQHRVPKNAHINLSKTNPNEDPGNDCNKSNTMDDFGDLVREIAMLQEQLYAENKHKLLIILQAMDTGGKDGVIRHVFEGVNPQGVRVASFKAPTSVELSHDYLWRVHQQVPAKGEIVIFNRSHYEDLLVVRVHGLVGEDVWQKRFQQINDFERMLSEEGTTILKFYLHIDLAEQAQRLLDRVEDPSKTWKFNPGDLEERKLWQQYMQAYEDLLNKTSSDWAPWYLVPANQKWYRNLVIASVVRDTLKSFDMHYPPAPDNLEVYRRQLLQLKAGK